MSQRQPERSSDDLLIHVSNGIVYLLSPEELEKWAALEERIEETRAEITMLLATVRDRKLTDYRDKFRDPEEEAILQDFCKEERAFFQTADSQELRLYGELLRSQGQAKLALAEMIRMAEERWPDGEDDR